MKGSCICGAYRFEVTGAPVAMNHCHCSICRKAGGAEYGTFVDVKKDDFHVLSGEDVRREYATSPYFTRAFCGTCGSTLPASSQAMDLVFIPAGMLDDDPGMTPQCHMFVRSKLPWHEIRDGLPQFDELPPGLMGEGA